MWLCVADDVRCRGSDSRPASVGSSCRRSCLLAGVAASAAPVHLASVRDRASLLDRQHGCRLRLHRSRRTPAGRSTRRDRSIGPLHTAILGGALLGLRARPPLDRGRRLTGRPARRVLAVSARTEARWTKRGRFRARGGRSSRRAASGRRMSRDLGRGRRRPRRRRRGRSRPRGISARARTLRIPGGSVPSGR